MTKEAPPDVKRRRISAGDSPHEGTRRLCDLPSGILAHAASFLAAPSRALFAIALDKDSTVATNERSSAIVGQCDVLDFGEIEKDLAKKLRDLDIKRVLQCIDAVNNLKRLKLTNICVGGWCFEPLRGSVVIEQIDLSLEGQNPLLDLAEPQIPCYYVLPILYSIIEREGCALRHLRFPSEWRYEPSTDSEFHAFIVRYEQMMRGRVDTSCAECNKLLPNGPGMAAWIINNTVSHHYGAQLYTCYGCLKHYCNFCESNEEDIDLYLRSEMLHECGVCRRSYCKGCSELTHCSVCGEGTCNRCYKYECANCTVEFCSDCAEGEKCDYCNKFCCEGCDDEEENDIYTCSRCDVKCCNDCQLQRYRQGQLHCTKCIKHSGLLLAVMGANLARNQLQEKNEQLEVENDKLKRQIEELKQKLENKELRSSSLE